MTRALALPALLRATDALNDDELAVLVELAQRLAKGREVYGPLELHHDPRDFRREAHEEFLDGAIYLAIKTLKERENE